MCYESKIKCVWMAPPQINYDQIFVCFHLCSRPHFFYLQAQHLSILTWLSRCLWLSCLQDTSPQYLYLEKPRFRVAHEALDPAGFYVLPETLGIPFSSVKVVVRQKTWQD